MAVPGHRRGALASVTALGDVVVLSFLDTGFARPYGVAVAPSRIVHQGRHAGARTVGSADATIRINVANQCVGSVGPTYGRSDNRQGDLEPAVMEVETLKGRSDSRLINRPVSTKRGEDQSDGHY